MGDRETDRFSIVRVDRVTEDFFPVREESSLGTAKYIADNETARRLPMGDRFVVLNQNGEPVYAPDLD